MTAKKGLGKGLGALFGELPQQTPSEQPTRMIPLQKIEPDPNQPRKRFDPVELENLAQSIRENGVIQPLTVRDMGDFYRIIAGERRWRAARIAGLEELPALVVEADDRHAAELSLIENLQRQDLDPIEEAQGYRRLIEEYGLTQAAVAESVSKARSTVTNALRLLELPESVQALLAENEHFTPGHARAVLQLKTEKQQLDAAQKISGLQLSVGQAELMCKAMTREEKKPATKPLEVDYVAECEAQLRRKLNRGVKIVNGQRKGHLTLDFYGNDDLQSLLDALHSLPAAKKVKNTVK